MTATNDRPVESQIERGPHETHRTYSEAEMQDFRRIRLAPSANLWLDRYQYAAEFAKSLERGSVIFDIGTGDCQMRPSVLAAGHVWRGFDLEPRDPEVESWDLNKPFAGPGKADAVFFLDVVEHLANPLLALQNIAPVLGDKGRLVITTPNPSWSRSRVHLALRGTLAGFTQHDFDWNHHCFIAWPHILEGLLKEAGLEVETFVTLDGKTSWPKLSPAFPFLCVEAGARKLMEMRDKGACGQSYAFVARPKR